MPLTESAMVERCLRERRERAIQALVEALERIDDGGPEKEPKPQPGSHRDPLLAYEDGHSDASWEAAKVARAAIKAWDAANGR